MSEIDGIAYGSFIVPGLMMLSLFTESIFNASFGIHMPRFTGTIYEILSAPMSAFETVLGYVGAAATKAMIVALVILATAHLFVDVHIEHPLLMLLYLAAGRADLLPVRLHHRHLGQGLRAIAGHPAADRHPADLSRRRILLDRNAAPSRGARSPCSTRSSI